MPACTGGTSTEARVEGLDIGVDELELNVVVLALDADGDRLTAALVVADHVGEELLDHQIDTKRGPFVDLVAARESIQEREDLGQRRDLAPELHALTAATSPTPQRLDATLGRRQEQAV